MAWQLYQRGRKNITFRDSDNPRRFALDATLASLHFETEPGSGVYDPIDMTPMRVNNALFDGWRVEQNGFHFLVGRDLENHGTEDGWLGFGARRGANWLKLRLVRAGYARWSDRSWVNLGSAASYVRSRLSQQTSSLTLPTTGEALPVATAATWADIWTTPGGGGLDLELRVDGNRLKMEPVIDQAARTWITANRGPGWAFPGEALSNVFFGFVFQADWSGIPRRIRAGVELGPTDDFADDGEGLELRDTLDNVLAFLPLDSLYVRDPATGDELARVPLRKRFWRDGDGNDYLLVGVRCDELAGLPAGELVFDPTIDEQVGAGSDDGYENSTTMNIDNATSARMSTNNKGAFRFTTVAVPDGATIDTCVPDMLLYNTSVDSPNNTVFRMQIGDAATLTTTASDISNRTFTTASVTATGTDIGTGWWSVQGTPPEIKTLLQEVIDDASWAENNDVLLMGTGADAFYVRPYENAAGNAAKLHIEYTAAAAAKAPPPFQRHTNRVWKRGF